MTRIQRSSPRRIQSLPNRRKGEGKRRLRRTLRIQRSSPRRIQNLPNLRKAEGNRRLRKTLRKQNTLLRCLKLQTCCYLPLHLQQVRKERRVKKIKLNLLHPKLLTQKPRKLLNLQPSRLWLHPKERARERTAKLLQRQSRSRRKRINRSLKQKS